MQNQSTPLKYQHHVSYRDCRAGADDDMRDIETPDTPKINLVISIDNRVASNFTNILEEVVGG